MTAEQYLFIRSSFRLDQNPDEVARILQLSVETVLRHQPRANVPRHARGKHLTDELRSEIRTAWCAGLTLKQITREFEIGDQTALRYRPSELAPRQRISEIQESIIVQGWRDKVNPSDIADRAGVGLTTVYKYRLR
ncbi:hypothetical protein [Sciscionella marina]|uniref:hypothetical protein n=1 Tax=Sciscionella marina TaxID=508770 RepID=UPI0003807EDA|nr:hypothetical protein [Sciscionella marina]